MDQGVQHEYATSRKRELSNTVLYDITPLFKALEFVLLCCWKKIDHDILPRKHIFLMLVLLQVNLVSAVGVCLSDQTSLEIGRCVSLQ